MLERLGRLPGLSEIAGSTTPDSVALEYSRSVLQLVPPYASLFLDERAMLNSDPAERVEVAYGRGGFRIEPEWRAGPADHLGLELLFLARLYEADIDSAGEFLQDHLLSWAPVCLLAITRIGAGRLYPALAGFTLDTLESLAAQKAG